MQSPPTTTLGNTAELQSRLDAVFGGLASARAEPAPWQPRNDLVFRSGPTDALSDEEDENMEHRRRAGLIGLDGLLEEDAECAPSFAFCRVVDTEEDFSAADAVADPLGGSQERPPLHTPISDANEGGLPVLSGSLDPSTMGTDTLPPLPKKGRMGLGSGPAGPPRPSTVPDHVRHPERYTQYTFDEPIIVGGGVGQLAASEPVQAAPATPPQQQDSEDAHEAERRDGAAGEPIAAAHGFGVVTFRPSGRSQRDGGGTRPTAPSARLAAVASTATDEDDEVGGGALERQAPASQRSAPRQYRRAGSGVIVP